MNFELTPTGKEKFQRIKDGRLLVLGILIGIIGNLFANIIDNLVRIDSIKYPFSYVFLITILLIGIILITLKEWFEIRFKIFRMQRLAKRTRKIMRYN